LWCIFTEGYRAFCEHLLAWKFQDRWVFKAIQEIDNVVVVRDMELSVNIYWPGSFRTDGFLKQYRKLTMLLL